MCLGMFGGCILNVFTAGQNRAGMNAHSDRVAVRQPLGEREECVRFSRLISRGRTTVGNAVTIQGKCGVS